VTELKTLLADTPLEITDQMDQPAQALSDGGAAPGVVVYDATDCAIEQCVAGIALMEAAWPRAGVVVIRDETAPAVVRSILDAGAVTIVASTTSPAQLRSTIRAAAEGRGLIDVDVVRPVIDLYATMHAESRRRNRAVIESLAAAVEAKDSVTSRHLRAVSRLATQLAREVDPTLTEDDDFLFGCLLHDVGKIGVPERILMKPAPLTDDEWEVMRCHPQTGANVVRPLGLSSVVTDVVLYHHERWDGRGYPERLAAQDIPLPARIFSVCDALEAMTATRPYRGPVPAQVAFERVRLEAGQQFDPQVIHALERGVETGSIDLQDAGMLDVDVRRGRRFTRQTLN
jgi:putative nucleotidyltransferase with HDIG domain